ncbi:hypothetical protein FCOIX_8051 [Fusarium coicis]|nr:hypothetical protein FCOIX_8051 [Fusarium coicis]
MSGILTRKETNPRSSSHAQLFIIVQPSNKWSFATLSHANGLWLTTQVRQTDISKIHTGFSPPDEDVNYFEITSIPNSWFRDVQVRVDLVAAIGMKGDLESNHQYVRDVLESLVVGGILGKTQSLLERSLLQVNNKMPDRSQPPARSASRGQLYIVVNRFNSLEDPSLPHGNFFFKARNLWTIVTQGPDSWWLYQGLLLYGNPCKKIPGQRFAIERPERQHLYFEVASFESDLQGYVEHILRFTDPEDADNR